jgi:hypothetical protein
MGDRVSKINKNKLYAQDIITILKEDLDRLAEYHEERIEELKAERNRFLTIAYNAIVLGQLDEIFDEDRLLKELGCTKEEYDEIMEC